MLQRGVETANRKERIMNTSASTYLTNFDSETKLRLPSIEDIEFSTLISIGRRVYSIGGTKDTKTLEAVPDCYFATVYSNEEIGEFEKTTPLPEGLVFSSCAVIDDEIYVFGGVRDNDDISDLIYKSKILYSGNLTTWEVVGKLPTPICDAAVVCVKNRVFLIGGVVGKGAINVSNKVHYTDIGKEDTFKWVESSTLPFSITQAKAVIIEESVCLIGGKIRFKETDNELDFPEIDESGVSDLIFKIPVTKDKLLDTDKLETVGSLPEPLVPNEVRYSFDKLWVSGVWDGHNLYYRTYSANICKDNWR